MEDDGSLTTLGNTFHSQFVDDDQAGTCLKLALESGGGRWALQPDSLQAGTSVVTVTPRDATDYSGPRTMTFLL